MSTKEEPEGGVTPPADGKGLSASDVGQMINSALSSHFKRFEKQIEQLVKPPEAKKAEETELQTLRRKVEELDAAKTKAETESRSQRTEARLRTTLAKATVGEDAQELAIAYLEKKGLLSYSEEGEPIVTLKKAKTKGGVPEPQQFTLEDGVAEWLRSDTAARSLVPAPKPTGKPAPTPGAPPTSTTPTQPTAGKRHLSERQRHEAIGNAMSQVATPDQE